MKKKKRISVLSLFSGCGGMDLGFEGGFIAPKKSFSSNSNDIESIINDDYVLLKKTSFKTIFANDILPEAKIAWTTFMKRFGYKEKIYHLESIVNIVNCHKDIFPKRVDVVTGGFPCQDFSLSGKRRGFASNKDDMGKSIEDNGGSSINRGNLYFCMKQVIDISLPKIFIAENVKGLLSLKDVKDKIQRDFASAGRDGYIVLSPKILHAGDYGVPESRERIIFIGIRRDALNKDALKALQMDVIPDEYNPYPKPTHSCTIRDDSLLPIVCCQDVFKNLEEPCDSNDSSQRVYSKARYMTHGQGQVEIKLDGLGPTIRSEHHGNIEFRRLSEEHCGKHINELQAGLIERRLTVRECALIQTFPPDYEFVIRNKLSASSAYKIIGNAVPPVLAFHIARRLEQVWNKYFL